ncbi:MAG: helix-turn-helix domain-containing protein [Pantoea ananatis]|nr:helix-turn-helix domain-containing protein [Pantoea ananatis]
MALSTLATRCRERRKHLNMSQLDLAEASGRTQAAVAQIEAGITTHPRNPLKLATALKCNPFWLLHGEDNDEKETSEHR